MIEIREISNGKKKDLDWIKSIIGMPFGFLQNIKMGGVGSPRLTYKGGSEILDKANDSFSASNYSNIQLYPKGILLRMSVNTLVYAAPIPFEQLGAMRMHAALNEPNIYDLTIEVQAKGALVFSVKAERMNTCISFLTRADFEGRFSLLR